MAFNDQTNAALASVWTKRCYFAGRTLMDAALRPYDLGSTQWYLLHHLASNGPSLQQDLMRALEIEKATLSGIVATLVRKELIAQVTDATDLRKRRLQLTPAGHALWERLPDLGFIRIAAFEGLDDAAILTTISVLKTATERLELQINRISHA